MMSAALVDITTLDNSDIRVTGPNGFDVLATFVSVDVNSNGTPRTATYEIAAPGNVFDFPDNGQYTISIEANQLFREITGRHDVTLRWMKDYEITIEEEGRERPFLNLSGGEQMAAALAVRLALLKELSEVNIAFFDEPTTNMDEERRRNLAQQIGRIKDFHQLFVISHDDSFEGYTDQIISLG